MIDEIETSSALEEDKVEEQRWNEEKSDPTNERIKRRRGFAVMDKEVHRELARLGGVAAHAYGLAHRFTSDQAREAGKKGGAKTSSNRSHMAEIGRRGGFAKRGFRQDAPRRLPEEVMPTVRKRQRVPKESERRSEETVPQSAQKTLTDDGERASDIAQVVAGPQIPQPSIVEVATSSERLPSPRGQRKGTDRGRDR